MQPLRVLAVDPGTQVAGWAVVEETTGNRTGSVRRLASGVWRLGGSRLPLPARLLTLRNSLRDALRQWSPSLVAVERAYFGRNANSALRLGEARGVVLVGAADAALPVWEIPPAQVKRRVAGAGNATKEQIARLVRAQIDLERDFESWDESDALAVGLCAVLDHRTPGSSEAAPAAGSLPPGAEYQ